MPHIPFTDLSLWLSPWTGQLVVFALTLCRVAGLLSVGPLLGRAVLPWPARVGLAIAVAMLLSPLVGPASIPSLDIFSGSRAVISELCLGFLLGCGSMLILWAVPLAGHLLDQQSGQVAIDDESDSAGSPQARWLTLWGTACFLLCSPINGHIQLVAVLCDSVRSWPLGDTNRSLFQPETAALLLQHACELSLTVIAPALATMFLVNLALGLIASTGLSAPSSVIGSSIRPVVSLFVLAASLAGINQSVADSLRWNVGDEIESAASRSVQAEEPDTGLPLDSADETDAETH
jgi:flagellar biosynthetic protein FliR